MFAEVTARVHRERPEGTYFIVLAPHQSLSDGLARYTEDGTIPGQLRLDDGRTISAEQRRKAYATIRDIADWSGDLPEFLKEDLKYLYIERTGAGHISLSDCSVSAARLFINFLIDFAMEHGVPLRETAINRTDDINAAIYSSLMHKRCIICGRDGELHHVDRVGMGRDRETIVHLGMRVMCLCRRHHDECHTSGQDVFDERYKVYGVEANKQICEKWRLSHD